MRKLKRERIKSESINRKIWLTKPPNILHTILHQGKRKKNTPIHHNAVQMFATKDL